jgi:hypothetical protein
MRPYKMKNIKSVCGFEECKKKLSITETISCTCKCGNSYCLLHRLSEKHNCSYNFKNEIDIVQFIEKNKCNSDKLNRI